MVMTFLVIVFNIQTTPFPRKLTTRTMPRPIKNFSSRFRGRIYNLSRKLSPQFFSVIALLCICTFALSLVVSRVGLGL